MKKQEILVGMLVGAIGICSLVEYYKKEERISFTDKQTEQRFERLVDELGYDRYKLAEEVKQNKHYRQITPEELDRAEYLYNKKGEDAFDIKYSLKECIERAEKSSEEYWQAVKQRAKNHQREVEKAYVLYNQKIRRELANDHCYQLQKRQFRRR